MKKRGLAVLIIAVCFVFSACGTDYVKAYSSDNDIAKGKDRYAKTMSVLNPVDGGWSLTAEKFDGRETIVTYKSEAEADIHLTIALEADEGKAKVVSVDGKEAVNVLAEVTPGKADEEVIVHFTEGKNAVKVIGCDCRNLDVKVTGIE